MLFLYIIFHKNKTSNFLTYIPSSGNSAKSLSEVQMIITAQFVTVSEAEIRCVFDGIC